jgi:18S rRNA (guanine1575-N7)-methyltransferase
VKKERPEEIYKDVRDYYKNDTLLKYAHSKNLMRIQERIAKRVIEILNFSDHNKLILDAGCGPGFASYYMLRKGLKLISLDLIDEFLKVYEMSNLNPINGDMCYSPIRPNTFDGIVSISALQWIYRDMYDFADNKKMIDLVKSFYSILKINGVVVIQFYPQNKKILDSIGNIFIKHAPFKGSFIFDDVDSPRKRKIYLKLIKS